MASPHDDALASRGDLASADESYQMKHAGSVIVDGGKCPCRQLENKQLDNLSD